MNSSFKTSAELELESQFLKDGYVICPVEEPELLNEIQSLAASLVSAHINVKCEDPLDFLNSIHRHLDSANLNDARLTVFNAMNNEAWLRVAYYRLATSTLQSLVGNELAMQRRVNLSIQLPNDHSSLLAMHTDTLSGDSPFEVVEWLPLVDCHDTKAMFILPPEQNAELQNRLSEFKGRGLDDLTDAVKDDLIWLDVPYGSVLIFNQNLFHGNVVNKEAETRWSMNCRFKAVFTPYADKKLGEFFEPITLRAASRIGLDYEYPGGFLDDNANV